MKRSAAYRALGKLAIRLGDRIPLDLLLRAIDRLAPLVPTNAKLATAAGDVLGLAGEDRQAWLRGATWGSFASVLVGARVAARGLRAVDRLLDPIDWSPVDAARKRGSGVLLLGAHLNPWRLTALAVGQRYPDTLFIRWQKPPGMEAFNIHPISDPVVNRRVLVAARAHLKKGGVVFMSPDGAARDVRDVRIGTARVFLSAAPPILARLSSAVAFPIAANWRGHRLAIELGATIEPPPRGTGGPTIEDDRRWLQLYCDWFTGVLLAHPELVTSTSVLTGARKYQKRKRPGGREPRDPRARPQTGRRRSPPGSPPAGTMA